MSNPDIRIFKLILKDDRIYWHVQRAFPNDAIRELNRGEERLELKAWCEERIDLLVKILKYLGTLLPAAEQPEDTDIVYHGIIKTIGEQLYELVFKNAVRKEFNTLLSDLKDGDLDLLRVELEFGDKQAQQLARWPWEYLCSLKDDQPYSGEFLASVTELMLNRRLFLENAADTKFKTPPPVRVLLVVSQPGQLSTVQHQQVFERLNALHEGNRIHLKTLIETREFSPDYAWQVTRTNFQDAVKGGEGPGGERFKPHVIHFIGHGRYEDGHGEVAFADAGGGVDWIPDDKFAEWAKHKELKLVFLQACESALGDPHKSVSGMALKLAHQNIPAVIAMQDKVENEVANTFACSFYDALAKRQPIDLAVKAGRKAVENLHHDAQRLAFGVPVLYLRSYQGLIDEPAPAVHHPRNVINLPTDTPEVKSCPRCRARVEDFVCPSCGLWLSCTKCGRAFSEPQSVRFCTKCGAAVPQHQWPPDDRYDHYEAQRKPPLVS
jgi:hypothetical protein